MQNLLIEQRGPSGLMKSWRLHANQKSMTFGHSKHADLRSPLDSIKGIQGIFEYREGKWYYFNLEVSTNISQFSDGKVELCIDGPVEIKIGPSYLSILPYDSRSQLFSSLDATSDLTHTSENRKPYQLFVVYQGATLLETAILPIKKTFKTRHSTQNSKIVTVESKDWVRTPVENLEIMQRTVYLNPKDASVSFTADQVIDEGGKKTLFASLAGAVLLALLFALSPAPQQQVIETQPVKLITREISTVVEKKHKTVAIAKPAPVVPEAAPEQASPPENHSTVSAIKNLAMGRISQLIGKVSATAARSKNVIVSAGVMAGSAPTDRALASVGNVERSGTDWKAEGKGSGVRISTNGVAGGKGVGEMGKMSTGNTGKAGVGLLEEESEINGGLDREVIAQYIKSKLGEVLYCYERQLSANPDLFGKIAVRFQINPSGEVDLQRIGESTLKNATVEGCILQKIARWKFPQPDGGTKVLVTYPFLFKSTN
jgi:hypothetical protein